MASPTTFPFGPAQSPDNITGLISGQAKVLGSIGDGTPIFDIIVAPVFVTLAASGAVGTVELYLACSETPGSGGNWTDGFDPTLATNQAAKISTARQIARVAVDAAGTTFKTDEVSVFAAAGFVPMYTCIVLYNNTNTNFSSTAANFIAQYSRINYVAPVPIAYA